MSNQDSQIHIDYNYTMADMLQAVSGREASAHGLTTAEIYSLRERLRAIRDHLNADVEDGLHTEFGFMNLPSQDEAALAPILATADRFADTTDRHIVLGIGGSFLGARMLFDALTPPFYNERSREERKGRPRMYFEGNSMDTDSAQGLLDLLRAARPTRVKRRFSLNVVSKSGETTETAVMFRHFRELARCIYGKRYGRYVAATTEVGTPLDQLSVQEGYARFNIPKNAGGRYSVLTAVGLLPAAIFGADIRELLRGARDMAERCTNPNLRQNPAYLYAALQYLLSTRKDKHISVMCVWAKQLEAFGMWYDQLCAESLGKRDAAGNHYGRTPLTAVGTRDLHSRGQQHQDGTRDKVITNLFVEQPCREHLPARAPSAIADPMDFIPEGTDLHEALRDAMDATNYAYAKDNRPTLNIILPVLNEYTLGQLIYLFELATVVEGKLLGINPLDQPGVQQYKNYMLGLLGRAEERRYKEEFERRPPPHLRYTTLPRSEYRCG